jgi:phospholipase C
MTPISRRAFVGASAATAAATVALPGTAAAATPADAKSKKKPKGSIEDVKHVVVLMQENRSFDHYFGTLSGVRGFDDPQAMTLPGGDSVFRQPHPSRADGFMLPFRMDASKYNAQNAAGLPHDWGTAHTAINGGANNKWVTAKGERTMGYFTRADIPYQYALADAFTLCDGYHCSQAGPTDPNRLFLWSGTCGPGTDGTTGPFTDNSIVTENPVADWTTYAERLEQAGVSWRVYHNPSLDDRTGDYDDNALSYFKQFHSFPADDPRYVNAMTKFDPAAFDKDCKDGTLPTVSWLVAPYLFCEHPEAGPNYGANWVDTALKSVFSNPDVWEHTVFLLMYDENDGYFDHVLPPFPEPGTAGEFADGGKPIGLGNRVPLWAISPWSRGGYVNSQLFDHTSVLRFLEQVTGVQEPNISAWRRSVCGDLTTCFDFSTPDYSIPKLPDTVALMKKADAADSLPVVKLPPVGGQSMATQEPGTRPHRALPYRPWADVAVDRASGKVTCSLVNEGTAAYPFTVLPNAVKESVGVPFTVAAGAQKTYVWDTSATDGVYDFSVYGPDGFLRRFSGTVVREGAEGGSAVASVSASLHGAKADNATVELKLANNGDTETSFTLTPQGGSKATKTVWVKAGSRSSVSWPVRDGAYDVTVSAATGTRFAHRFAGTVHTA